MSKLLLIVTIFYLVYSVSGSPFGAGISDSFCNINLTCGKGFFCCKHNSACCPLFHRIGDLVVPRIKFMDPQL
uniref:Cysteine rich secreted protein n=1 Tax=Riptortus pedestris TaxID=329032 RepID=R4WCT9_RIPPE|nr:cysteine rich secreted protein [Riptortus pedestris]